MRALKNIRRFPCTYKNGRLITLEECECCSRSGNCDIYAMILDDSDEDEVC